MKLQIQLLVLALCVISCTSAPQVFPEDIDFFAGKPVRTMPGKENVWTCQLSMPRSEAASQLATELSQEKGWRHTSHPTIDVFSLKKDGYEHVVMVNSGRVGDSDLIIDDESHCIVTLHRKKI